MAVFSTVTWIGFDDGLLTISMAPQQPIGNWTIHFQLNKQTGIDTSGLVNKYVSSGLNNASGINITSSGAGQFNIAINSLDISGLPTGTYYYSTMRTDSGSVSMLAEGYFILQP